MPRMFTEKPHGLVAAKDADSWRCLTDDVEWSFYDGSAEALDHALTTDTNFLVTELLPRSVSACHGLRWVQLISAGTEQMVGHPLLQHDIQWTHAGGLCAEHIAQYALGRILYHYRDFAACAELQKKHAWPDRHAMAAPSLRGMHIVIFGYGGVGREVARLGHTVGMKITAVNRSGQPEVYRGWQAPGTGDAQGNLPTAWFPPAGISEAVENCDVLLLAAPLTPATRGLVGEAVFRRLKPTSILINVGRGAVIDTPALLAALASGYLAQAYLDVFEQEPLPGESVLWDHPGLTLSPHLSGVMPDAESRLQQLFLENFVRWRRGEELLNRVDDGSMRTST